MARFTKQMLKAEESEKCGGCLYANLTKKEPKKFLDWSGHYFTREIGFGSCTSSGQKGLKIREDELCCSLYQPR